jgi:hypothetical protein
MIGINIPFQQIQKRNRNLIYNFSKKSEDRDKAKIRTKEYSKGTGFTKEEHKFKPVSEADQTTKPKNENFLNNEEFDNLQDLMNYAAASMNQTDLFPIETLYSKNPTQTTNVYYTNDKINSEIEDILAT